MSRIDPNKTGHPFEDGLFIKYSEVNLVTSSYLAQLSKLPRTLWLTHDQTRPLSRFKKPQRNTRDIRGESEISDVFII
jgi:hypothetical protein